ncbi:MAG: SWIM zinc finger family protein [Anaerolineae bacterium]
MSPIPQLTEQDIRNRVGDQSFERGRRYYRDGAVFDARRQGMTLKARCAGSRAEAYRLEVMFDVEGIAKADCSCPVGAGGHCKHTAALLLTWLNRPEDFTEVEELDAALERRSKAELIALIKQMLRQEPDLELLLETPLPTGKRQAPANPEVYRRQVNAVFQREPDWGADTAIAADLLAIKAIGDGFAEQGDWASAAAVYEAIARGATENYEMFQDEEGDLANAINESAEGLGQCFAGETDPSRREGIMRALFDVFHFDVEYGGVGIGDEVPDIIMEHATAEERRTVAAWVRQAMPQGSSWSDNYHRQVYGGFLLDLEADTLDDEAYLSICREMGLIADLVDRLLALGRVDEATSATEQADDYPLIRLADIFVEYGRGDVAERLMLERSAKSKDTRVLEWLKKHYSAQGNSAAALKLAERMFRLRPNLDLYIEIGQLAQPLGHWEEARLQLIAFLEQRGDWDLLIRIYLNEGEVDQALETLQARPMRSYSYGLELEVARAAEETQPRAAIDIYQQHAERLIAARGRGNYQQACASLAKARALYERSGERGAWASYIADLRSQNRSLRAFQEELTAAGL